MAIKLELAALDSSDMGLCRRWRNDYAVWKWCRQTGPISDAEQVRWFNKQSEDPSIRMFKVLAKTDDKAAAVGVAGLTAIDYMNSRAEFSLYIAPEAQGKGLGRMALALLLNHGFDNLGLNLIWGETFEGNPAADLFVSLGFVREGVRRQFYFRDGQRIGAHLFSITSGEWRERRSTLSRRGAGAEPPRAEPSGDGLVDDRNAAICRDQAAKAAGKNRYFRGLKKVQPAAKD